VAPLPRAKGHLSLDWSLFTTVLIGYSLARPNLHRISKDDYLNMMLAMRNLRRLGYRRVGLALSAPINDRVDQRSPAAYRAYQEHHGMKRSVPPLIPDHLGEREFLAWYRRHRPDAIVCAELRSVAWLTRQGVRVPADVGVVHVNLPPAPQDMTGVDPNMRVVGGVALELVEAQLHQNERGIPVQPKLVLIEGKWCAGNTVCRQ